MIIFESLHVQNKHGNGPGHDRSKQIELQEAREKRKKAEFDMTSTQTKVLISELSEMKTVISKKARVSALGRTLKLASNEDTKNAIKKIVNLALEM